MNRSTALFMIPLAASLALAAPAFAQVAHPGAAAALTGSSVSGDVTQVQWGHGGYGYGRGVPGYGRGYGYRGYGYGHRGYGYGHRGYGYGHRGYGFGPRRYGW